MKASLFEIMPPPSCVCPKSVLGTFSPEFKPPTTTLLEGEPFSEGKITTIFVKIKLLKVQ
jgi:hypothetical protein